MRELEKRLQSSRDCVTMFRRGLLMLAAGREEENAKSGTPKSSMCWASPKDWSFMVKNPSEIVSWETKPSTHIWEKDSVMGCWLVM